MNKKAFTLIEIMTVLMVLGILIALAIPRIKGMIDQANIAKVKGELQSLQTAVVSYYTFHNPRQFGTSGLAVWNTGTSCDIGTDDTAPSTSLLSESPQVITAAIKDPYNTSYDYYFETSPNRKYYVISSRGPDGIFSCFVAGTKILLANGKIVMIEDLKVGDIVIGLNGAHNKVTDIHVIPKGTRRIYAFNEGRYFVTDSHIFMTKDGWKAINDKAGQKKYPHLKVGKLKQGDELVTNHGYILLKRIRSKMIERTLLYDPEMDGNHTYYADGFLVHNPCVEYGYGIDYLNAPRVTDSGQVFNSNQSTFGPGRDNLCVSNGKGC